MFSPRIVPGMLEVKVPVLSLQKAQRQGRGTLSCSRPGQPPVSTRCPSFAEQPKESTG